MTINPTAIHSDIAIPPGEYLEEIIEDLGMTKEELARRMNRPAPKLSPIFKGEKAITPDTAIQIEKVLGVPAHIWTGLEAEYRLILARQEETKRRRQYKHEVDLIPKYCFNDLVRSGFIPKTTKPTEKVAALQRFFGVTCLNAIPELRRYQPAFRCRGSQKSQSSPHALAAWLRLGEIMAQGIECAPFRKAALKQLLPELRRMTRRSPNEIVDDLRCKLAETGVTWALAPHLPKTYAWGATFWMRKDKAVLMTTIRGKWADIFWFGLFHEIGHLLLHTPQKIFIETEEINTDQIPPETEADRFASDMLIPPAKYKAFLKQGEFYPEAIREFADEIGIDAGILVGRLQHEKRIHPSRHNELRTRYDWAESY